MVQSENFVKIVEKYFYLEWENSIKKESLKAYF